MPSRSFSEMNLGIRALSLAATAWALFACASATGKSEQIPWRELHVSAQGNDSNSGGKENPLLTISEAALRAMPGDVITVHEGVYRERVNPPRGGSSNDMRIVYRAAPGEKVVIKGSEPIKGWQRIQNDTWSLTLPDSYFGGFNPFKDEIGGDWYWRKDRTVHTGAVYLDGHWLLEAANLKSVLDPVGEQPLWFTPSDRSEGYLLNVAWLDLTENEKVAGRLTADSFESQSGIQTAACSEGGMCVGWVDDGDWTRYKNVDFGAGTSSVEIRAASETAGGKIELHLNSPEGELLGECVISGTGGWQKWETFKIPIKTTSGKQAICLVYLSAEPPTIVEEDSTTIWAQFKDINPNQADVEINVRQSVFYPQKPGINFITVRGFTLMHAATNWAPPTAEQIGLIGTHWSKGWIIEDNTICYSACTGITLGKHGDEWDNTSADSAEGYVKTIERGLENGWSKENIGSHVVRNNTISHCEQAGIVGSLGAAFSSITRNTLHDIHVRRLFTGAEMAAIKFHGALDSVISHNHIFRSSRGIWLDWMTQGTRVSGNLLHDNGPSEDLFLEVNHGPFLVDNNICLSPNSLLINSQGGAYAHNLFAGQVRVIHGERRLTPANQPHSTALAGLHPNPSGDDRYYNNIFAAGNGLVSYDSAKLKMHLEGNVFLNGALPCKQEMQPTFDSKFNPKIQLKEDSGSWILEMMHASSWLTSKPRSLVTSDLLGQTATNSFPFEAADGSPITLNSDYFGYPRDKNNPIPGPFELSGTGKASIGIWPCKW